MAVTGMWCGSVSLHCSCSSVNKKEERETVCSLGLSNIETFIIKESFLLQIQIVSLLLCDLLSPVATEAVPFHRDVLKCLIAAAASRSSSGGSLGRRHIGNQSPSFQKVFPPVLELVSISPCEHQMKQLSVIRDHGI